VRHIRVLVTDEERERVTRMLDDEGFEYVRQRAWRNGEKCWLVEIPAPTDGVGHVLDELSAAGVDVTAYTTVSRLETAMSPGIERLQNRFSTDFDPLRPPELRSKAQDMARDPASFLAMVFLSAVIAVAGLLIESPAVVVGSMVIAPLVGPVLTASVGAVTNDRRMLLHSLWLQGAGLAVAIIGAVGVSFGLQASGFFSSTLDITAIDLIALRIGPNFVTVLIGLAAGAGGAYGLMTKGPTSLIGVMIAAALIPAAGTVGVAIAWGEVRIALGATLLLVLSVIVINLGAVLTLRWFYRRSQSGWLFGAPTFKGRAAAIGSVLAVAVILLVVGGAAGQQLDDERTIQGEVEGVLQSPAYETVDLVSTRIEFVWPSQEPAPTVTVIASRPAGSEPTPELATTLDREITAAIDRPVHVRVRFRDYRHSSYGESIAKNIARVPANAIQPTVTRTWPSSEPAIFG